MKKIFDSEFNFHSANLTISTFYSPSKSLITPTSDFNATFQTLIQFFKSTVIKYEKSLNKITCVIDY